MIVKLSPPLKNYIWGGTKLKTEYGKICDTNVAESWELSFCPGDESVVASGEQAGKILPAVCTRKDWGSNCDKFPMFPTLVKLIDSQQNLSVQVHPGDDYALQHENQFGKTEMWHILQAEKDAKIYLGLNRSMTREQFVQAVQNGTVCDCLNAVPVHPGETYFVASGTFHAIGAGVTLIEIQQNSTLTYRVYDYGRVDANGNPRPLHLEKAMAVANLQRYSVPNPARSGLLGECEYFSASKLQGSHNLFNPASFTCVTVTEGQLFVGNLTLQKGESAFVSAGEKVALTGGATYVLTCVK